MSCITWTPAAVSSEARTWKGRAWRVVEAQHVASTMKIVDNAEEQDLLESLLESGKPALSGNAAKLHYLLATPFRYDPRRGGSRFRSPTDPGVFYAAGSVRTACAELGYWRWQFLHDAVDLERLDPVAQTAFRTDFLTSAIDLRAPPFSVSAQRWHDPLDYAATHALAAIAREAAIGAILYRSVRDPEPGWCVAILTADAFAATRPDANMQTWWLAVRRDGVVWRREGASMIFSAAHPAWGGSPRV